MESAKEGQSKPAKAASGEEKQAQRERQGLLLSRAYVQQQIASSTNENYLKSLRQALSEIEQKLAGLDGK